MLDRDPERQVREGVDRRERGRPAVVQQAAARAERDHQIEQVGVRLRALMPFLKPVTIAEEEVVGAARARMSKARTSRPRPRPTRASRGGSRRCSRSARRCRARSTCARRCTACSKSWPSTTAPSAAWSRCCTTTANCTSRPPTASTHRRTRVRYRLGEGITGRVVESGKPIVVPRVSREPAFLQSRVEAPRAAAAGAELHLRADRCSNRRAVGALGRRPQVQAGSRLRPQRASSSASSRR